MPAPAARIADPARLAVVALLAFVLGGLVGLLVVPGAQQRLVAGLPGSREAPARVGGPFKLVDHTGRPVTEQDFRGRLLLIVFGATRSPDATPAALQLVAEALARLGPRAERIVPVLITIDPAHDTPAELARYVARFDPRLVGLTGPAAAITAAARAWHVAAHNSDGGDKPGEARVETAARIYLMGADGAYITHFDPAVGLDEMGRRLAAELS